MHNPQGQFAQSSVVFQRCTATKGNGCCNLIGIGACKVEGAIASQTHTQHIDARLVEDIVQLHPLQYLVQFMRIPPTTGILGGYYQGRNHQSHLGSVNRPIAQHTVEVAPTETGTVQKDNQRGCLLRIVVFFWCVNPEIVTALYHPLLSRQQIVLRLER